MSFKVKDKAMPETGNHSYRAALAHSVGINGTKDQAEFASYTNRSEKGRVQLFTSIDVTVHEIDLM